MRESHSGTSLAASDGVNLGGSRKMSSKMTCSFAMVSTWFVISITDYDSCGCWLVGVKTQSIFPALRGDRSGRKAHARVKLTHHLILRRGQVNPFEPRTTFFPGVTNQLVEHRLLHLSFEHPAAHQPRINLQGIATHLANDY